MSIPINTTTVTVLRAVTDPDRDPYDTPLDVEVVASGVRAHISTSRGREAVAGGSQEVVFFRLSADPIDLHHLDQVQDEITGEVYEVEWARLRLGFGLEHTEAGLKQVAGVISQVPTFTGGGR